MNREIVISVKTIIITILIILGLYIVYRLGPIIALLFLAGLLVIALEPTVKFFMNITFLNNGMPRGLAVLCTYFLFISFLAIVITVGMPPVVTEGQKLISSLPNTLNSLQLTDHIKKQLLDVQQVRDISTNVISATFSVFSNIAGLLSILVLSIYMSLDWQNLKKHFLGFFKRPLREEVFETLEEVERDIAKWVRGELLLMTIIGVLSFIGLVLLGIDYPLALGLIAGMLEAIPIIGPIISAVLASIIGFADSPIKGLTALALFTLIQQLENNLLVPKIMQEVSGFSPLVIFLALLIGSTFFGITGALLAVPMTMIGVIVVKKVLRYI